MNRKNVFLCFSFVIFSVSVMGWGTKNRVDENSSILQSNVTNLVAEFEDHVNLVDKEINENSLEERRRKEFFRQIDPKLLETLNKYNSVEYFIDNPLIWNQDGSLSNEIIKEKFEEYIAKELSLTFKSNQAEIAHQIIIVEEQLNKTTYQEEHMMLTQQLTKLEKDFEKALYLDRPYEERLRKAPKLVQIAMNRRPMQKIEEFFELDIFLAKKEGIELGKPYEFHIISEPTQLDYYKGYCFKTVMINNHLSQEVLYTWDKINHQYFFTPNLSLRGQVIISSINLLSRSSFEETIGYINSLLQSKVEIKMKVIFTKDEISVTNRFIIKKGKMFLMIDQNFIDNKEFVQFLNIAPYELP